MLPSHVHRYQAHTHVVHTQTYRPNSHAHKIVLENPKGVGSGQHHLMSHAASRSAQSTLAVCREPSKAGRRDHREQRSGGKRRGKMAGSGPWAHGSQWRRTLPCLPEKAQKRAVNMCAQQTRKPEGASTQPHCPLKDRRVFLVNMHLASRSKRELTALQAPGWFCQQTKNSNGGLGGNTLPVGGHS